MAVWQAFPLRNQRFCTPNHHFFAPIHRDVVLAQIRAPQKEGGTVLWGGTVLLIPPDTQATTRSTNPKQKHHVHKRNIPNSKQNKTQIQSKMTRHTQAKHTQFRAKRDRDKTTSIPVHKRNTQFEVKRVTNPNKTTRHTSEIHTQFGQNEPYIMSFPGTPLLQLCSRLLQL